MDSLKVLEYKCCPWLDLEGQPPFAPFSMKFCFLNVGSLPHTCLPSPVPDPAEEQSFKSPFASCKVFKSGIGLLLELVEFSLKCHEDTLELVRIQTWAVIWAQGVERNSTGFAKPSPFGPCHCRGCQPHQGLLHSALLCQTCGFPVHILISLQRKRNGKVNR